MTGENGTQSCDCVPFHVWGLVWPQTGSNDATKRSVASKVEEWQERRLFSRPFYESAPQMADRPSLSSGDACPGIGPGRLDALPLLEAST